MAEFRISVTLVPSVPFSPPPPLYGCDHALCGDRGPGGADVEPTAGPLLGAAAEFFPELGTIGIGLVADSMRKDFVFEPAAYRADWRKQCC